MPVRVGVPDVRGRPRRRRAQPALRHRRRAAARGREQFLRGRLRARRSPASAASRADEAMVQGEFLSDESEPISGDSGIAGSVDSGRNRWQSESDIGTSRLVELHRTSTGDTAMFEIMDQTPQEGAVIKVIGVGGCGGNAVDHMIDARRAGRGVHLRQHRRAGAQALDRAHAAAARLDAHARASARAPSPEIGRDAAMEDRERIAEMIDGRRHAVHHRRHGRRHRHRRGAGGRRNRARDWASSRSRWSPSRSRFEGKRQRVAQAGIEELEQARRFADRHPQRQADAGAGRGRAAARRLHAPPTTCCTARSPGIAEVINYPGLVNVDFADVRTVMAEVGMAMMGSATASGADRGAHRGRAGGARARCSRT